MPIHYIIPEEVYIHFCPFPRHPFRWCSSEWLEINHAKRRKNKVWRRQQTDEFHVICNASGMNNTMPCTNRNWFKQGISNIALRHKRQIDNVFGGGQYKYLFSYFLLAPFGSNNAVDDGLRFILISFWIPYLVILLTLCWCGDYISFYCTLTRECRNELRARVYSAIFKLKNNTPQPTESIYSRNPFR